MPKVKPLTGARVEPRWKEWEERIVSEYGMLLTTAQLGKVIGMSSYDKIKRWAEAEGVEAVPIGSRKKWDARSVAKVLDRARFRAIS